MIVKLGDKIQCVRNDDIIFWWEFKVGNVYTVIEKTGMLAMKTENDSDGYEKFILSAETFFEMFYDNGVARVNEWERIKSLEFKILKRCGAKEELE